MPFLRFPPTTPARYITFHPPAFAGQRDARYGAHDGGRTQDRWRILLNVAKTLKFDGVRSDAILWRFAPHPDPRVLSYRPWEVLHPLIDFVAPTGMRLLVNLGYNPWRENWSQLAGYEGSNEEIARWWRDRSQSPRYEGWRLRMWGNERRPPAATFDALRRGYQAMIDALVVRWQRAGRKTADLSFSFWQEPDGAGGNDAATAMQSGWDPQFHQMATALLAGDSPLDFHEAFCWGPAFTPLAGFGRQAALSAKDGAAYWRRFDGFSMNLYIQGIRGGPGGWVEAMVALAKRAADELSSVASIAGKPLAVHELSGSPPEMELADNGPEVGRALREAEMRICQLRRFDAIGIYTLNHDSPIADSKSYTRYGFAPANPSPDWYRRLQGYAEALGVDRYRDRPPSGRWIV